MRLDCSASFRQPFWFRVFKMENHLRELKTEMVRMQVELTTARLQVTAAQQRYAATQPSATGVQPVDRHEDGDDATFGFRSRERMGHTCDDETSLLWRTKLNESMQYADQRHRSQTPLCLFVMLLEGPSFRPNRRNSGFQWCFLVSRMLPASADMTQGLAARFPPTTGLRIPAL